LSDPQSIAPSARRTSLVVETSAYFSLPVGMAFSQETLHDCPCDFPGSRRKSGYVRDGKRADNPVNPLSGNRPS